MSYAVNHLGLTASQVGATFGAYGVGMLVGTLATPWVAKGVAFGWMIVIGPATALAGALAMTATTFHPSRVLAGVSFFLFGAGPIIWVIMTPTLRQAVTPIPILGRLSVVLMTATSGSRPIGAALSAVVAAHPGTSGCMVVALTGFTIQLVVTIASPVPRLRELPHVACSL